jgi:hypothetical protein
LKTVILKNGVGNPEGFIRKIAGDQERLYSRGGNALASYRSNVDFTYTNRGARIGSGDRLAGLVRERK